MTGREQAGEMEVRELTLSDREEITLRFLEVFTAEPWCDDWSDTGQLYDYITDLAGQDNSLTLGYMRDGHIAALAMGRIKHWYTGTEYCIDEFFVSTPFQRKGIGSAFLRDMKEFLSRRGIEQIFLQTDRNVPAYDFYLKNGFLEMEDIVSFAARTSEEGA